MPGKPKTYHSGAEAERKAIKEYLRRLLRNAPAGASVAVIGTILAWVQGRSDRYRKRGCGL